MSKKKRKDEVIAIFDYVLGGTVEAPYRLVLRGEGGRKSVFESDRKHVDFFISQPLDKPSGNSDMKIETDRYD